MPATPRSRTEPPEVPRFSTSPTKHEDVAVVDYKEPNSSSPLATLLWHAPHRTAAEERRFSAARMAVTLSGFSRFSGISGIPSSFGSALADPISIFPAPEAARDLQDLLRCALRHPRNLFEHSPGARALFAASLEEEIRFKHDTVTPLYGDRLGQRTV